MRGHLDIQPLRLLSVGGHHLGCCLEAPSTTYNVGLGNHNLAANMHAVGWGLGEKCQPRMKREIPQQYVMIPYLDNDLNMRPGATLWDMVHKSTLGDCDLGSGRG